MNTEEKMISTIANLKERLTNIRAGRANPAMLNGIMVSYYGTPTPIQSVASFSVPEAKELVIKPFDRSSLKDIERAINEANIGITPVNNGEIIILQVPDLTEDRRKEYVKMANSLGEEAKVALRNIRQDAKEEILALEFPEDEEKKEIDKIQDLINKYNKNVDDEIKLKEQELMKF
jgi:ribosome recycling factor